QKLGGVALERLKVGDEQQELRADQRTDDDIDAQVHHPGAVEMARLGALERQLQAKQVGGGEQNAVRVDRDRSNEGNRPRQLKQSWMHARLLRAYPES